MADINWGILQSPQGSGPQTSIVQTPNYALQNEQGLLQGAAQMNQAVNQAQQMGIERARLGNETKNTNSEIAARNQAMQFQAQMQPGLLQGQQLQNQGQNLSNQKSKMELGGAQLQVQQQQERMQAYNQASQAGGSESGLDAVQDTLFKQGHIKEGLDMSKTRETLKYQIASDNKQGIAAITSAAVGSIQRAQPAVVNPKTGQVLKPALTPLQVYTQQYPTLKKMYPDAPKPESFRDNAAYEDTFVHPVLDTAKNYIAEDKAAHDEMVKQELYKAQGVVQQRTKELQELVKMKGSDDQETKDAALALNQAQQDATRVARGNGYLAGALAGFKDVLPESLGGNPSVSTTIQKFAQPTQPTPASNPNAPVQVPQGRVLVKDPSGKLGHIPADQVQDAIKSGYSQVKE